MAEKKRSRDEVENELLELHREVKRLKADIEKDSKSVRRRERWPLLRILLGFSKRPSPFNVLLTSESPDSLKLSSS